MVAWHGGTRLNSWVISRGKIFFPSDKPATKVQFYFVGGAKLKDLVNELQGVRDWFRLGMCLRVPESVLMTIRRDIQTTSTCRQEMLTAWMKREVPTWSTLVKALLDMGMPDLAMEIASKYFGKFNLHTDCTCGWMINVICFFEVFLYIM